MKLGPWIKHEATFGDAEDDPRTPDGRSILELGGIVRRQSMSVEEADSATPIAFNILFWGPGDDEIIAYRILENE